MGKGTEEARLDVMGEFPGLCSDEHFLITSPIDYSYNCIAWAYQIKGRWMWPPSGIPAYLDAVTFWPDENASEEVEEFVKAAGKCDFDIDIFYNRVIIDAKSILGVLGLDFNRELTVQYAGYRCACNL